MSNQRIKIGLSIGDHNGIGPEIAIKASQVLATNPRIELKLIGDRGVIDFYANQLSISAKELPEIIHVPTIDNLIDLVPGKVCPIAGKATIEYLKKAVELAQAGSIDAILAAPHNETAVNAAGISFNGYPGKLAELTNTPKDQVFIMLVGGDLRITHVTLHEGLKSALNKINKDLVVNAGQASINALKQFGFENPKLAVFGINPHAGENGLFGLEDQEHTFPAVKELKAKGYDVSQPEGADVLLANRKHDVYLAMYHDQGHIPIKLMYPNQAAAITIGTPCIFSSVAHGTAMDIAGKGIANPAALINAAEVLLSMFRED